MRCAARVTRVSTGIVAFSSSARMSSIGSVVGADRPDVLDYVDSSNRGRLAHLLPLRVGRMVSSPFAFFRGAAGLHAADLAGVPTSGLSAQLCGDAHAANFGLYGTPDGDIVMDINDFDETVPGPWEWDLLRLAASLVLAGSEGDVDAERWIGAGEQADAEVPPVLLDARRRVVLATNVAETSLTVPGIRYVVDPGTARISRYSQRTKVQRLPIEEISQASANQRSGRSGRIADGVAIRLYSEDDFDALDDEEDGLL